MDGIDGERPARRRHRPDTPRTMRPVQAGLYEGPELRAERVDGLWRAEALMRDVGTFAEGSPSTGLYEFHPDGTWTPVGGYRTLRLAEVALEMLKAGTHLVRLAYGQSCGNAMIKGPTRLIPYAEARDLMVAYGLAEAPAAGDGAAPAHP